jgi:uncharacterized membrane protein
MAWFRLLLLVLSALVCRAVEGPAANPAGATAVPATKVESSQPAAKPVAPSGFLVGPNPEKTAFFATRILPVFNKECFACHAGKRNFGNLTMDTLAGLLAGGERYGASVVPWDAAKSVLIRSIRWEGDDKDLYMPPKTKLSAEVIADITRWVEWGAPWPLAAGDAGKAQAVKPEHGSFLGRMHPAVVHMPIAVLLLAALFELLAMVRGESWRPAVLVSLALSVAGGVVSVITGIILDRGQGSELLERHEMLGWVAVALTMGALVAAWQARNQVAWRWVLRVLLVAGVVAVAMVGHLGGELVHG